MIYREVVLCEAQISQGERNKTKNNIFVFMWIFVTNEFFYYGVIDVSDRCKDQTYPKAFIKKFLK